MSLIHKEPYITPEMIDRWEGKIVDFVTANDVNTTHDVPNMPSGWTQDNTIVEIVYIHVTSYYVYYTDQVNAKFTLFWQSNVLRYQNNMEAMKNCDVRIRLKKYV